MCLALLHHTALEVHSRPVLAPGCRPGCTALVGVGFPHCRYFSTLAQSDTAVVVFLIALSISACTYRLTAVTSERCCASLCSLHVCAHEAEMLLVDRGFYMQQAFNCRMRCCWPTLWVCDVLLFTAMDASTCMRLQFDVHCRCVWGM